MTGRIKEIIITGFFLLTPFIILAAMSSTAGGENIAPVPIEDALKADPVLQVPILGHYLKKPRRYHCEWSA